MNEFLEVPSTPNKRDELTILGRVIGTFDGWDGDMDAMVFYAFKPCSVLEQNMPEGDLNVDYTRGDFTYFEDDGTLYKTIDMLTVLNMMKKSEFA